MSVGSQSRHFCRAPELHSGKAWALTSMSSSKTDDAVAIRDQKIQGAKRALEDITPSPTSSHSKSPEEMRHPPAYQTKWNDSLRAVTLNVDFVSFNTVTAILHAAFFKKKKVCC